MNPKLLIFGIFLIVTLISACVPQPVRIEGNAMLPNFSDGDKVLMDRNIGELKRGDVVMFLYPKDQSKFYIKRIVGLPGESIEIRDGKTFINGEILNETYIDDNYNQSKQTFPPREIEAKHYFVIGDNRDNSSDSRYWGTVDIKLVKGKYYTTYSKAK